MVRGAKGPVYIKTHNAVANVEGFPTVNFDVTLAAIYIVRNPLDVAVSYAHYSGLPFDPIIAHMADPPAISTSAAGASGNSWAPGAFIRRAGCRCRTGPFLLMRYEDMLAAPERSFGRLAAFLRLRADADQLGVRLRNPPSPKWPGKRNSTVSTSGRGQRRNSSARARLANGGKPCRQPKSAPSSPPTGR